MQLEQSTLSVVFGGLLLGLLDVELAFAVPSTLARDKTTTVTTPATAGTQEATSEHVIRGTDIVSGVFWGKAVEETLPVDTGFSRNELWSWRETVKQALNITLSSGPESCGEYQDDQEIVMVVNGRSLNGSVKFDKPTALEACARYCKFELDVAGALYSQQLAHELGLANVLPEVAVLPDNFTLPKPANDEEPTAGADWPRGHAVLLSRSFEEAAAAAAGDVELHAFREVHVPDVLLSDHGRLRPYDAVKAVLVNSVAAGRRLAQWTDMVVFDYLIGNSKRLVSQLGRVRSRANQVVVVVPHVLEDEQTGLLVFNGNDEGMTFGYEKLGSVQKQHMEALRAHCVFRRQTIDNVQRLASLGTQELQRQLYTAVVGGSPKVPAAKFALDVEAFATLRERLTDVLNHVKHCSSV